MKRQGKSRLKLDPSLCNLELFSCVLENTYVPLHSTSAIDIALFVRTTPEYQCDRFRTQHSRVLVRSISHSGVRRYLLYLSKQLYNPQHTPVAHSLCHQCNTGGTTCPLSCFSSNVLPWDLRLLNFCHTHDQVT